MPPRIGGILVQWAFLRHIGRFYRGIAESQDTEASLSQAEGLQPVSG
jgi:hypothetical protein